MVEKLISNMDENYETTKNESRDSVIGTLQLKAAEIFPALVMAHSDSFFWHSEYYQGEKINEQELKNGELTFNELKQNLVMQKENGVQKAA